MATTQGRPAAPQRPAAGNAPANWDDHLADKQLRSEEMQRNRPKHLACLDPLTAAEYERAKPIFEWKVECKVFRPAGKNRRAGTQDFAEQVVAQNEDDAWAMFCDKIGEWPSRRDCNPTITKLKKRSFDND